MRGHEEDGCGAVDVAPELVFGDATEVGLNGDAGVWWGAATPGLGGLPLQCPVDVRPLDGVRWQLVRF